MEMHRLMPSLISWGYVNYYKSAHHPIPTRENREHPGNFQNKSVLLSIEFCRFTF